MKDTRAGVDRAEFSAAARRPGYSDGRRMSDRPYVGVKALLAYQLRITGTFSGAVH